MRQFKTHLPFAFIGKKHGDNKYQIALATYLFEGETVTVSEPATQPAGTAFQLDFTIGGNKISEKVGVGRPNTAIYTIDTAVVGQRTELEIVVWEKGTATDRTYSNMLFADAVALDDDLTETTILPLLVLEQEKWANPDVQNSKDEFNPGVLLVGNGRIEGRPGAYFELELKTGGPKGPRVPTNPAPPPKNKMADNETVNLVAEVKADAADELEMHTVETGF